MQPPNCSNLPPYRCPLVLVAFTFCPCKSLTSLAFSFSEDKSMSTKVDNVAEAPDPESQKLSFRQSWM